MTVKVWGLAARVCGSRVAVHRDRRCRRGSKCCWGSEGGGCRCKSYASDNPVHYFLPVNIATSVSAGWRVVMQVDNGESRE